MPEWRNWQTHTTQNRAGNRAGSSPALGTKKSFLIFIKKNVIIYIYIYKVKKGNKKYETKTHD